MSYGTDTETSYPVSLLISVCIVRVCTIYSACVLLVNTYTEMVSLYTMFNKCIPPVDSTRVVLDNPDNDYINANHVRVSC